MDADFSHAPGYLPGFVAALQDADVVYGSRYVAGGRLDERWSTGRRLLSRFGNVYARAILGLRALDVTGGYRLWRRATLAALPLERVRSNGYVFQVEMAYFEDRRVGESKMSFRIQVEAALRVWQVLAHHRHLTPADRRVT
jgi:dolichol-phosphate mannosyltransferase